MNEIPAHKWDGQYWHCLDCNRFSVDPCTCPCCHSEFFSRKDIIFVDATEPDFGAAIGTQLMYVHHPDKCAGSHCCIHNPSDHHMKTWRKNWRADRGIMERICMHGIGHPDPDDLKVKTSPYEGVHGCDGCCRSVTE